MNDPIISSDADSTTTKGLVEDLNEKSEANGSIRARSEPLQEGQAAPELLTGMPLKMLVVGISLAGFIYSLDIGIIVTAIPVITTHFHTIQDIGWYGSAYLITLCATAPLAGKLYQFYNHKYTFFTFIIVFEIGSLVCGIAPTSTVLIIGRAIAGIGGGGILGGAFTILANSAPKEIRTQLLALVYAFSLLGTLTAPILGGVLTQKASWRWCFYINLPVGAIALTFITFLRIPGNRLRSENKPSLAESFHRLDLIGFALFAPTCVMVLLALQWGGSKYAWNSSVIIGLFVGFAATLTAFLLWEYRRGDSAMVPFSIMRKRVVYFSCLVMMTQYGATAISLYYLPLWLQTILGVGPILGGVYFLAFAGTIVVVNVTTGIMSAKLGSPAIFTLLGNGIATIGTGLLCTFSPFTHAAAWAGYQVLAGLGRGMTLQQPINAVQHALTPSTMAVGTSMILFCQYFGGAFFLALAETDFSSSLRSGLVKYAPDVDAQLIVEVGASGLRKAVTSEQLPGVLLAYNEAVRNTFYLATAVTGLTFLLGWGMGFKNIQQKKESSRDKDNSTEA